MNRHFLPLLTKAPLLGVVVFFLGTLAYYRPSEHEILPPCQFYEWTSLFCPGCGATRAVHFLLRGNWKMSLHYNLLILLFLPVVLLLLFRGFYGIFHHRSFHHPLQGKLYFGLAIAVIVFFVLRNIPWIGFAILRPPI